MSFFIDTHTSKKYLKFSLLPLLLILLSSAVFATHNPSVSHSANQITNGTFLDNYTVNGTFNFTNNVTFGPSIKFIPSGSVGIGTASPAVRLTIAGDAASGTTYLRLTDNSAGNLATFQMDSSGNHMTIATGAAGNNNFEISSSGYTALTGGNVGIGTAGPQRRLQINGTGGVSLETNESVILATATAQNVTIGNLTTLLGITDGGDRILAIRGGVGSNRAGILELIGNDNSAYSGNPVGAVSFVINSAGTPILLSEIRGSRTNDTLSGQLSFFTSDRGISTERMTINSSGNVGIGTTSPAGLLHLASNTDVRTYLQLALTGSDPGAGFLFRRSRGTIASPTDVANGDTVWAISGQPYSGGFLTTTTIAEQVDGTFTSGQRPPSRLIFNTNTANSAGTERVRIDSSGNVGINTTSPTGVLHVSAGGQSNALVINGTNGGVGIGTDNPLSALTISQNRNLTFGTSASHTSLWQGTDASDDFFISNERLATNSDIVFMTNAVNRTIITGSGLVGIGTTSPRTKLDIQTSTTGQYGLQVQNTGDNSVLLVNNTVNTGASTVSISGDKAGRSEVMFGRQSSESVGMIRYAHATDVMTFNTNTTQRMIIDNLGQLGIGTASPSSTLHVVSNRTNGDGLRVTNSSNSVDVFFVNSTLGAVGIGTASPLQKLVVVGDLNVTGNTIFGAQNFTNIDASGNLIVGRNLTVSNNVLFVNNNTGRVGIGTTTPSSTLQVLGGATINGSVYVNNTVYQQGYTSDDGLVGYWTFSEGIGSAIYDSSPFASDGVMQNMNTTGNMTSGWNSTSCISGTCMQFNGINNLINMSRTLALNITTSLTLEAWVNPQNASNSIGQQVLGKYDYLNSKRAYDIQVGQGLLGTSNAAFLFIISSDGSTRYAVATNTNIQNNTWYHVVAVWNGNYSTIYLNGINDTQATSLSGTISSIFGSYASFTIGGYDGNANSADFFKGMVDEVKVYNRALSPEEVRLHYLQGLKSFGAEYTNTFRLINSTASKFLEVNQTNFAYRTNQLFVDSAGNVGINTTSPTGVLHVSAGGVTNALVVNGTTGSVGIGTASPNLFGVANINALTIRGNAGDNRGIVEFVNPTPAAGSVLGGLRFYNGTSGSATAVLDIESDSEIANGGVFKFYTNNTDTTNPRMVIKRNVGINTLFPYRRLQVNGTMETNESAYFAVTSGSVGIGTASPDSTLAVSGNLSVTTGTVLARSSGNVSIGTTDIATKLYVNASAIGVARFANGAATTNNDASIFLDSSRSTAGSPVNQCQGVTAGYSVTQNDNAGHLSLDVRSNGGCNAVGLIVRGQPSATPNVGIGTTAPFAKLMVNGTTPALQVNDSAYLAVSGGNVGIGTTSPSSTLHVVGDLRSQVSGDTADYGLFSQGTTGLLIAANRKNITINAAAGNPNGGRMIFQIAGSTAMFIDNASNVGIGTSTPLQALTITGNLNFTGASTIFSGGGNDLTISPSGDIRPSRPIIPTGDNTINLGHASFYWGTLYTNLIYTKDKVGINTSVPNATLHVLGTGTGGGLRVTNQSNGAEVFFVNSTLGAVGIGTTSLIAKLQVNGESGNNVLFGSDGTNGVWGQVFAQGADTGGTGGVVAYGRSGFSATLGQITKFAKLSHSTTGDVGYISVGAASDFQILTGDAQANTAYSSSNAKLTIKNGGNVGIGTTNPTIGVSDMKLVINSDSSTTGFLGFQDTRSGSARNFTIGPGNGGAGIFGIRDNTAGVNRISIDTNGNVGINTTSPTQTLTVVGDANVTGTLYVGAQSFSTIDATGNLTVGGSGFINGNVSTNGTLWQPVYTSDDGLVLYYPFSETVGSTVYDRSPYGNDGVCNLSCNWTAGGKHGAALSLQGNSGPTVNRYVNVSDSASLKPVREITVMGWARASSSSASAYLLDKRNSSGNTGYMFQINGLGFQIFSEGGEITASPNTNYKDGNWHHFAGTYNGTTNKIYVDGILLANKTAAVSNILYDNSTPLIIGAANGGASELNGTIDEVRIYNRTLSQDEIRLQYLGGLQSKGTIVADKFRIVNTTAGRFLEANQTGFAVFTSGSERVRIDSSGNVGINTTTPTGVLHVSAGGITNALVVNGTTGSVGIGTTSPSVGGGTSDVILTISDSSANNVGRLELNSERPDGAGRAGGKLYYTFSSNAAGNRTIGIIQTETEGATANQRGGILEFFTKPNGGTSATERMRIDSSGNVGINATPAVPLHMIADGTEIARFTAVRNSVNAYMKLNTTQTASSIGLLLETTAGTAMGIRGDTAGRLTLHTGALTSNVMGNANAKMTILDNGKTGINAYPTVNATLHIMGNNTNGDGLRVTNQSNAYEAFFVNSTLGMVGIGIANPGVLLDIQGSEGTTHIRTLVGGNSRLTIGTDSSSNVLLRSGNNVDLRLGVGADNVVIKNGGSVGINTTSPTQTLTVVGNANVTGTLYVGAQSFSTIDATGNLTVGGSGFINGNVSTNGTLWQPVYPSDDGLVLYLPFSEGAGTTVYDRSPYGNDGTLRNRTGGPCGTADACPSWTSGKYGSALQFDGDGDYIDVGNTSSINVNTISFSAWVKMNSYTPSSNVRVISKEGSGGNGRGWRLTIATNSRPSFDLGNDTNSASASAGAALAMNDSTWHYIAGTANTTQVQLFIDGVFIANTSHSLLGNIYGVQNLTIGILGSLTSGTVFNGTIDEVKIWNRTLSVDEIRTQYLGGLQSHGTIFADKFRIVNTTGSANLYMNPTGQVGIGNTAPNATLHILGTGTGGGFRVTNQSNGIESFFVNTSLNTVHIGSTAYPVVLDPLDTVLIIDSSNNNRGGNIELVGNRMQGSSGNDNQIHIVNSLGGTYYDVAMITGGTTSVDRFSSGVLRFLTRTNGTSSTTERMTIDENGNLGIGTAAPYAKLMVNGTTPALQVNDSAYLAVSGGRVGIGTTSPFDIFHVYAPSNPIITFQGTGGGNVRLRFNVTSPSDANQRNWEIGRDNSNFGDFYIMQSTTNLGAPSVEVMTMSRTGNVGIGTTTPYRRLQINGTGNTSLETNESVYLATASGQNVGIGTIVPNRAAYSSAKVLTLESVNSPAAAIELSTTKADAAGNIVGDVAWSATANTGGADTRISYLRGATEGTTANQRGGNIQFVTRADGGALTEAMRIDSNQRLGIGTTSPNAALTVENSAGTFAVFNGSSASNHQMVIHNRNSGGSAAALIRFVNDVGNFAQIAFPSNSSTVPSALTIDNEAIGPGSVVRFATQGTERVRIDSSGNVGIGTATPVARLHVVGNATIEGNVSINGTLWMPVYPSDDKLVLYLPFSEGTGTTAYDRSPYGNDGTLKNATGTCDGNACPNWTAGKYGTALDFDGVGDYVDLPSSGSLVFNGSSNITVQAWVNVRNYMNSWGSVVGQTGGTCAINANEIGSFLLRVNRNNGKPLFAVNTSGGVDSASSSDSLFNNTWYHLAGTYDGSTIRLYVNGILQVSTSLTGTLGGNITTRIGACNQSSAAIEPFNGTIDEVKIYNRTLSTDEIRTQYLGGLQSKGTIVADKFRIVNTTGSTNLYMNPTGQVGIGNTAPNATLHILGTGTGGGFRVTNQSNGAEVFFVNSTLGAVGIGTTSPSAALQIVGATADQLRLGMDTSSYYKIGRETNTGFLDFAGVQATFTGYRFYVNTNTNVLTIINSGNVGIGTTAPNAVLNVSGSGTGAMMGITNTNNNAILSIDTLQSNGDEWQIWNAVSGTTSQLQFRDIDVGNVPVVIQENGNVGIGTTAPVARLHVEGNVTINASGTGIVPLKIAGAQGQTANLTEWYNTTLNGTTAVAYINSTGSLFAQSKNFEIPHPLNASRKLVHSSLEGPEQGIYYRGEAQLADGSATIALPSYFEALAMKNDRTVQLTPKDGWSPLYIDGDVDGKFTVKTTPDGNKSQKFYWTVYAKRGDITVEK